MSTRAIYIVGASRTAIGSFGGAFQNVSPIVLGTTTTRATIERSKFEGAALAVDEVIVGNVLGAGHGMNIARQVSLGSGVPVSTPASTVNMVCGSGLKAVSLGAQSIANGDADVVIAAGVESMSQAPYVSRSMRWGSRMGDASMADLMITDGLTDAFGKCHMGITAENIAAKYQITREMQDIFAAESQRRAQVAIQQGMFKDEIAPVEIPQKNKDPLRIDVDEYPRAGSTSESLAKLRPAFKPDGTVTAGNASGINDGAASVLLVSETSLRKHNLTPIAEIVGWASGGVDPSVMGLGPVEAVTKLLKKTGASISQIDAIESNEAFAVQALAVQKLLEFNPSIVNEWGGAIALGHPIGASGARILVTLLSRMRAGQRKLGLATLCVGGGQGIAVLVRRA